MNESDINIYSERGRNENKTVYEQGFNFGFAKGVEIGALTERRAIVKILEERGLIK